MTFFKQFISFDQQKFFFLRTHGDDFQYFVFSVTQGYLKFGLCVMSCDSTWKSRRKNGLFVWCFWLWISQILKRWIWPPYLRRIQNLASFKKLLKINVSLRELFCKVKSCKHVPVFMRLANNTRFRFLLTWINTKRLALNPVSATSKVTDLWFKKLHFEIRTLTAVLDLFMAWKSPDIFFREIVNVSNLWIGSIFFKRRSKFLRSGGGRFWGLTLNFQVT